MFRHIKLTYNKIIKFFTKHATSQLGHYYYEQLFNRYRNKDCYIQILHQLEHQKSITTGVNIKLSSKFDQFNIDLKSVEKHYGKPNFKIRHKKQASKIDFLLYRTHLGKHKVKLELHFYRGELALFCYRFAQLGDNDIKEMQHIIEEKYNQSIPIDFSNSYLIDHHKNILQMHQDGDFMLRYISIDNALFENIKRDIIQQKNEKTLLEKNHLKTLKRKL